MYYTRQNIIAQDIKYIEIRKNQCYKKYLTNLKDVRLNGKEFASMMRGQ